MLVFKVLESWLRSDVTLMYIILQGFFDEGN